MSQFPHDEFVKEYLPELIQEYGEARAAKNISAERREIDVFFQPNRTVPTTPETLGLLGKLAQTTTLFEVFRNPVESYQITECLGKLFSLQTALGKQKRKKQQPSSPETEPFLWLLTPTLSEQKLALFGGKSSPEWEQGVYFLVPGLKTGIVVIHQLPVNPNTLWLRILGRGKVQENAIDEVKALPKTHPYRENVLELIGNLFAMLVINKPPAQTLELEEQELIMKLSSIYTEKLAESENIGLQKGIQQGLEQGIQQGLEQGIQQGEASLIIRQIKRKLGNISQDLETKIMSLSSPKLEELGEALLNFPSLDDVINWFNNPTNP
jgi:hypothetical protein